MKALVKLRRDIVQDSMSKMDFPQESIKNAVSQLDKEIVAELHDGEVYIEGVHVPSKYCEYIRVQGLRQRYE